MINKISTGAKVVMISLNNGLKIHFNQKLQSFVAQIITVQINVGNF